MTEFIHVKNCTTDEQAKLWVAEKLTSWADNIPYHKFRNFGRNITIKSIMFKPSYHADLYSQYEKRTVSAGRQPYQGQAIPPREYYQASDVDPWKRELSSYDEFIDQEESYYVGGSQYVKSCTHCNGRGEVTCSGCNGEKTKQCSSCGGRGRSRCDSCGGRGSIKRSCGNCDGGYKQYWDETLKSYNAAPCSYCGGSGSKTENCSQCRGSGEKECYKCGGAGKITCSRCNGYGVIDCQACGAVGKVMHYLQILQQLNYERYSDTLHHESVSEAFPRFAIDTDETTGNQVADIDTEEVCADFIEDNPALTAGLQSLLNVAGEPLSNATHIIRQTLQMDRFDVYEIAYTFDNVDYSLLIYGEDRAVYSLKSPITKVRDGYYREALEAFEKKNYSGSHKAIQKAAAMMDNQDVEEITELRDKLTKRVGRTYRIGSGVAALISAVALWGYTVDFLAEPRFFLPYFNDLFLNSAWMPGLHAYVAFGIFAMVLLSHVTTDHEYSSLIKFYGARVNSGVLRFLLAMVVTAVNAGLMWISVMALNFSGLTLIFTYPVHWVQLVYQFVVGLFS